MTHTTGGQPRTDADYDAVADTFASDDLDVRAADVWTHPHLVGLIAAVEAKREAEAAVVTHVRQAREQKVPWTMIAAVLGVSHQAAMKRFKPLLAPAGEAAPGRP